MLIGLCYPRRRDLLDCILWYVLEAAPAFIWFVPFLRITFLNQLHALLHLENDEAWGLSIKTIVSSHA